MKIGMLTKKVDVGGEGKPISSEIFSVESYREYKQYVYNQRYQMIVTEELQ